MRRSLALLVLAGALAAGALPALATGIMGGDAPARIPVPARDFSAVVEDVTGEEVALDRVTFNGEVFLYGRVGAGQVTVPFERIDEVRIEPHQDAGRVVAFAVLRDGQTARVVVEDDVPVYGATSFGNYQVEVGKLRKVRFPEPAP